MNVLGRIFLNSRKERRKDVKTERRKDVKTERVFFVRCRRTYVLNNNNYHNFCFRSLRSFHLAETLSSRKLDVEFGRRILFVFLL